MQRDLIWLITLIWTLLVIFNLVSCQTSICSCCWVMLSIVYMRILCIAMWRSSTYTTFGIKLTPRITLNHTILVSILMGLGRKLLGVTRNVRRYSHPYDYSNRIALMLFMHHHVLRNVGMEDKSYCSASSVNTIWHESCLVWCSIGRLPTLQLCVLLLQRWVSCWLNSLTWLHSCVAVGLFQSKCNAIPYYPIFGMYMDHKNPF